MIARMLLSPRVKSSWLESMSCARVPCSFVRAAIGCMTATLPAAAPTEERHYTAGQFEVTTTQSSRTLQSSESDSKYVSFSDMLSVADRFAKILAAFVL